VSDLTVSAVEIRNTPEGGRCTWLLGSV